MLDVSSIIVWKLYLFVDLMYGKNKNNVRIFEAENSENLENSKNTEPEVDFGVFL